MWVGTEDQPRHEMTETPWSVGLLDSEQTKKTNTAPQQRSSKVRDCIRHLRLQFLSLILDRFSIWRLPIERRKVAMYQNRPMVALHSLLHVVPLSGSVTLLVLYWTKYWVGETFDDATTLQFVAKLHEVVMQASIIDIFLCIIRTQAIDGYVPLGALSGATQATQLSYLWSLDFISAISAPAFSRWRKAMFAFSIPLLILMTALVGPSAAILMIPRSNTPYQYSTNTWYTNGLEASLFPSLVNKPHELDFKFDGWNNTRYAATSVGLETPTILNGLWVEPDTFGLPLRASQFSILVGNGSHSDVKDNYSTATIPTRFSAALLWDVYILNEMDGQMPLNPYFTVQIAQPLVVAACKQQPMNAMLEEDVYYLLDDGSERVLSRSHDLFDKILDRSSTNNMTEWPYFPPLWMRSPEAGSASLIGVFYNPDNMRVCTISSFWHTVETVLSFNIRGHMVQTSHFEGKGVKEQENVRPILVNVDDITSVHTVKFNGDLDHFGGLTWDIPHYGFANYETVLAVMFAAALSEIPNITEINITEMTWYENQSEIDTNTMTAFKTTVKLFGYGYGTTNTSVRLAVAVITTYCILIIVYMAYTLIIGSTSTAWNSAIELVTLALQSKRPGHLGHTSVGIESMETFRQSVGIRVNSEEVLELVFAHDRDVESRELHKIERNKAY